jgi:predicted NUDIX family phosphoesterase
MAAHILTVKNNALDHLKALVPEDGGVFLECYIGSVILQGDLWIGCRPVLEEDPTHRQIIPYAVIMDSVGRILTYRRTKQGNEGRLHGNASIGFGGHLDLADVAFNDDSEIDLDESLSACNWREITEEIGNIRLIPAYEQAGGLIIDNSNDVGRVHLGAVSFYKWQESDVVIEATEDHLEILGFMPIDDILALPEVESWSRIVLEHLKK